MNSLDKHLLIVRELKAAKKLCKQTGVNFRDWATANMPGYKWETIKKFSSAANSSRPGDVLASRRARHALAQRQYTARLKARSSAAMISPVDSVKVFYRALSKKDKAAFTEWMAREK